MTDSFTASNGMTVERDHNNDVVIDRSIGCASVFMADGTALALREFFQHERDEELGRWRWPENPDYVVYPRARAVLVLSESTGVTLRAERGQFSAREATVFGAASAYFEAHPERKPPPEIDGIYAVSPNVHPYERLIQRRNGEWIHLRRSASEFETDNISAQSIAQSAVDEGRLTRLVAEHAS